MAACSLDAGEERIISWSLAETQAEREEESRVCAAGLARTLAHWSRTEKEIRDVTRAWHRALHELGQEGETGRLTWARFASVSRRERVGPRAFFPLALVHDRSWPRKLKHGRFYLLHHQHVHFRHIAFVKEIIEHDDFAILLVGNLPYVGKNFRG